MSEQLACRGADFCEELAGSQDVSFAYMYEGNPPSRVIVADSDFVLIADMSPLVVGHLLLLPRVHYLSFATVVRDMPTEVSAFLDGVLTRYTVTFGRPLVLEHGSTAGHDGQACITHAHWHLLPIDGDEVDAVLARQGVVYQDLGGLFDIATEPWTNSSYYLRMFGNRYRMYRPEAGHRRQFLRSVAGEVLSIEDPEWDYAVVVRKEMLRTTLAMTTDW